MKQRFQNQKQKYSDHGKCAIVFNSSCIDLVHARIGLLDVNNKGLKAKSTSLQSFNHGVVLVEERFLIIGID